MAGGAPVPSPALPPTTRRRLGCWGIGFITCGSLFLIFAVFIGVALWLARPYAGRLFRTSQEVALCMQQLQAIHGGIERYRRTRGVLPPSLLALHPRFISRRQIFHCPADDGPANRVSYTYRAPAGTASASDSGGAEPLVVCTHHRVDLGGQKAAYLLQLKRDGTIEQVTRPLAPSERP
jgi:hypothetical protein